MFCASSLLVFLLVCGTAHQTQGVQLDTNKNFDHDPTMQQLMQQVEAVLPEHLSDSCNPACRCVHGRCDDITGICICEPGFTGALCNNTVLYFRQMMAHGIAPEPRAYGAYGVYDSSFVVAGGMVQYEDIYTRQMDFYVLDVPKLKWNKFALTEDHPNGRSDSAYFMFEDKLYIFGGFDVLGFYRNDMTYVSVGDGVWKHIDFNNCTDAVPPPTPRSRSSATVVDTKAFLWGGVFKDEHNSIQYYQDFHVFDLVSNKWVKIEVGGGLAPSPRAGHSMTLIGKKLYLFGGGTMNNQYLNDIHAFSTETLRWEQLTVQGFPPSARVMHQATAYQNKIIIFGGDDQNLGFSDQLYVFDTVRSKWVNPPVKGDSPGARWGHGMFVYGERMYTFGGYNGKYLTGQMLGLPIPPCEGGCVHGVCTIGTCECDPGYIGHDCATPCFDGWAGDFCDVPICHNKCNGRGFCELPGQCKCYQGFSGSDCEQVHCDKDCSNHGICTAPPSTDPLGNVIPGIGSNSTKPVAPSGIPRPRCECFDGWTGHDCGTPVCPQGCHVPGGSCTQPGMCTCASGYTGDICNHKICPEVECVHGSLMERYCECDCFAGWAGPNCTQAVCHPECLEHGVCVGPAQCECRQGWKGATCSEPVCENDCSGKGVCESPGKCHCLAGWGGPSCAAAQCANNCNGQGECVQPSQCACNEKRSGFDCSEFACLNNCSDRGLCSNENKCICNEGWSGLDCSIAICRFGCVHGKCVLPDHCQCDLNFMGIDCSEASVCASGCNSRGHCSPTDKVCNCIAGYAPPDCLQPICPSNCSGHGACVRPGVCGCEDGWKGDDCSEHDCGLTICVHGKCGALSIDALNHIQRGCKCFAGWEGETCEKPVCVGCNTDHGVCESPGVCKCHYGWEGRTCNKPRCDADWLPKCNLEHGMCVEPDKCVCVEGWTGPDCSTPVCPETCDESFGDKCVAPGECVCAHGASGKGCERLACPQDCSGKGICQQSNCGNCSRATECQCLPGYTGEDCSIMNCPAQCNGRGSCVIPGQCICSNGWTGLTCDVKKCPEDCSGHGACKSGTCKCAFGYSGDACDKVVCPALCSLHGRCNTTTGECHCQPDYTGADCSNPTCPKHCLGNGHCNYTSKTCVCDPGWTGVDCGTTICLNRCSNQGNCTAPGVCTCNAGYSGVDCSQPICKQCLHGTCVSPGVCTCHSLWRGVTCDMPICPKGSNGTECSPHGRCVAPSQCQCDDLWSGPTCEVPVCAGNCSAHGAFALVWAEMRDSALPQELFWTRTLRRTTKVRLR